MRPIGSLGALILDEDRRGEAIRAVAEVFDVNAVVARIRINEMFPQKPASCCSKFLIDSVRKVSLHCTVGKGVQ